MKKQLRKGSMTIETALLMPVILLVIMTVLYLFFYVHNRAWLTAAAYEAALSGSMEAAVPDGNSREAMFTLPNPGTVFTMTEPAAD